jgi:hypothetical protein
MACTALPHSFVLDGAERLADSLPAPNNAHVISLADPSSWVEWSLS